MPEEEITITGTVREIRDGVAMVEAVAKRGGKKIIRNAEAELATD